MKFKIKEVEVLISEYFVLFLTVLLVFDKTGLCVYALAACLIHETGHILALYILSFKRYTIEFRMFGIKIIKKETEGNYKEELFFSAMGPSFNMIAAAIILIINGTPDYFFYMNIAVLLFNILPIYPLDGYRIIENSAGILFSNNMAKAICNYFTVVFIAILFFFAIYILIQYKNPTLLITTIYLTFAICRKR